MMLICMSGCAEPSGVLLLPRRIQLSPIKPLTGSSSAWSISWRWSSSGRHTISCKTPSSFGACRRWSSAASSSSIVKCFMGSTPWVNSGTRYYNRVWRARLNTCNLLPQMLPQAPQRDLSDERDRLRFLLAVNNAVVATLSLKDLLYTVSGWLRKFFPLDFASMVIKDEESGMLKIHALDAPPPGGVLDEGSVIHLEGRAAGIAIATRETVMRARID